MSRFDLSVKASKGTLYYVYDPMCSWCWAYQPVLEQVRKALAQQVKMVNVLGGLAADSDEPMDGSMQQHLQDVWRTIEAETGTAFNHDFWTKNTPRRSTYIACRAVLAAAKQNNEIDMVQTIGMAYYQRAMNPSDEDTLLQLADEMSLDFDQFKLDLRSKAIDAELQNHIRLARAMKANSFPGWVVGINGQFHSIAVDYHSAHPTLAQISDVLR